jgi:transposase InsO family protein
MEATSSKPQRILRINKDGSLSAEAQEFNATLRILRDDQEQFPVEHGKFKVPPSKEHDCIRDHHDGPTLGHPGVARTAEHIRRNFVFPDMRRKVSEYVKRCDNCNKNKATRHAKYGNLEFREPPHKPWDEVTMDFIVKLPISTDPVTSHQYDSILVMVDRLTKYSHFIPCSETITAQQLGCLVLDRLVRYHGIPTVFITDRDKLFTSNYWKTLVAAMGIKHKLSTAFHPQTDGQTERNNQTLEAYLRHYVNYVQDNWVALLPMAQVAINNNASETTHVTPFYANFGKDPNLFMEALTGPQTDRALQSSASLHDIHDKMRQAISTSQAALTSQRHKDSKTAPQLEKGDKVYLLTKNLKTRRGTKKLDHVKVGPFLVDEQRGKASYRLRLPKDARIHPVFHISLLEPADSTIPLQTTFHFEPQEEQEFEVEKILQQRGQQYLVKWKGYPDTDNTWEPVTHLKNSQDLLTQFRHHRSTLDRAGNSRRHRPEPARNRPTRV